MVSACGIQCERAPYDLRLSLDLECGAAWRADQVGLPGPLARISTRTFAGCASSGAYCHSMSACGRSFGTQCENVTRVQCGRADVVRARRVSAT